MLGLLSFALSGFLVLNQVNATLKESSMHRLRMMMLTALLIFPISSWSAEIEGVSLPEAIQLEGKTLQLNGAGIRSKFFFDIYVAALYLDQHSSNAGSIITATATKRVSMDFLYDEVSKEKLTDGWNSSFANNQSAQQMRALQERLNRFNSFFVTSHKGDRIVFYFTESGATHVSINGHQAGSIAGADFQQALLSVWLGNKPADKKLKQAMLGH